MQQLHSQLESLHLELQSLKRGREGKPKVRVEIWCLKCKSHEHDKDHFSVFKNYIIGGGPLPLKPETNIGKSMGSTVWCAIFHGTGQHATDNCHLL